METDDYTPLPDMENIGPRRRLGDNSLQNRLNRDVEAGHLVERNNHVNRVRDKTSGLKFVVKGFMGFYMATLTILQLSRTKTHSPFHIHTDLMFVSMLTFMCTVLSSWLIVWMYPRYPQHRPTLEKLSYAVYLSAFISSVVLGYVLFHP